jgi:hypothetical protein
MFLNHKIFPELSKSLVFVSNQHLNSKLLNGKLSTNEQLIKFSDLAGKDKEIIRSALEGQEAKVCEYHGLAKLQINHIEMGVDEHTTFAKGRLTDFFEVQFPGQSVSLPLAYKTLADEISRKNNFEGSCTNFVGLKENKSVSKSQLDAMMELIVDHRNFEEIWHQLIALSNSKWSFSALKRIKGYCQRYFVERMDVSNEALYMQRQLICKILKETQAQKQNFDLYDLVQHSKKEFEENSETNHIFGALDGCDVEAAIICEAMLDDPIQKVNTKSEEEEE